MSRPLGEGLAKKSGPVITHRLPVGSGDVLAIEEYLPDLRIGAQGETAYIDDAGLPHRDAIIREEIHIAADLPIFNGVHYAIDVDLVIDHIDLVIHFPQVEIRDVRLIQREIIKPVQRLRAIGAHLLVGDFIFLPVRSGNRSL